MECNISDSSIQDPVEERLRLSSLAHIAYSANSGKSTTLAPGQSSQRIGERSMARRRYLFPPSMF
jgi:hypothetical protein